MHAVPLAACGRENESPLDHLSGGDLYSQVMLSNWDHFSWCPVRPAVAVLVQACRVQQPCTVIHCQDLHEVSPYTIDDPVIAAQYLPNVRCGDFRNRTTQFRERLEPLDGLQYVYGKQSSVVLGIS